MSVQQEHATSETATLTTTESGGVYQSLFDKINLTPVSSIQEIDLWQNSETLADASPDERVTAAIHVLLSCLAKSGENVVKLDKSAYSALFDHGLASKSDQRFASIRSTGNLTFSTAF